MPHRVDGSVLAQPTPRPPSAFQTWEPMVDWREEVARSVAAYKRGINIGEGIGELGPTGPRAPTPGPISEFLLDKAKKQWSLSVPGIIQQRGWQGLTEPFRNADWGAANPRWLWDENWRTPVVRNPNPFRDWTRSGSSPGG